MASKEQENSDSSCRLSYGGFISGCHMRRVASIAAPVPKRGTGVSALPHPLVVILVKLIWLDRGNNVGRDVSWHCLQRERENNSPKRGLVFIPPLFCSWDSQSAQCLRLLSRSNPGEQRRGRKLLIHLLQRAVCDSLRKNYGK